MSLHAYAIYTAWPPLVTQHPLFIDTDALLSLSFSRSSKSLFAETNRDSPQLREIDSASYMEQATHLTPPPELPSLDWLIAPRVENSKQLSRTPMIPNLRLAPFPDKRYED